MRNVVLLNLLLLLVTSCNLGPKAENEKLSIKPSATGANTPRRWPNSKLPLKVYIANDFIADFTIAQDDGDGYNLFQQMQKQWNLSDAGRNYFDLSTDYNTANLNYGELSDYLDGQIGIYKSSTWFLGASQNTDSNPHNDLSPGILAITTYLVSSRGSFDEIIHGDIIVNYNEFTFTNSTLDTGDAFDLPSVILHELGHLIGLGHTSSISTPSVMQPYFGKHDIKRGITSYDASTIKTQYDSHFLALTSRALSITASEDEPTYKFGYIELRADGECHHYQDGKLIDIHRTKVTK